MDLNTISPDAIDRFNAERFEFMNSGFARASARDFEAARLLSVKMLESAIRMQEMPVAFKEQPPVVRTVTYSFW